MAVSRLTEKRQPTEQTDRRKKNITCTLRQSCPFQSGSSFQDQHVSPGWSNIGIFDGIDSEYSQREHTTIKHKSTGYSFRLTEANKPITKKYISKC
jgi:hypothetical protein